jgi:hypothetical protein
LIHAYKDFENGAWIKARAEDVKQIETELKAHKELGDTLQSKRD